MPTSQPHQTARERRVQRAAAASARREIAEDVDQLNEALHPPLREGLPPLPPVRK